MQLVILAAGHGRRFGGLKQLAPVGPKGEAIMDYTARSADACGYEGLVVVVRDEIRDEIARHIRRAWPASLGVELVCQEPTPGTAQAVLSARSALGAHFGVANADDLYGTEALALLRGAFLPDPGPVPGGPAPLAHLLVAFRLSQTVLTSAPVTRGLCKVSSEGGLVGIVEHTVARQHDGSFSAVPLGDDRPPLALAGDELVSMNLWGFEGRILDHLETALEGFVPMAHGRRELLLPDVVGALVASEGDAVRVVETASRCIGVTHQEDLALVGRELADLEQAGAGKPLGS